MSPSFFNKLEYIDITPFEMELIKKIEVIENNKLANIRIVLNLFAINALIESCKIYLKFLGILNFHSEFKMN